MNGKWLNANIKYKDNFLKLCNYLFTVGIGTMLFHGTLLYPFQLLDELPMLLVANQYIRLLLQLKITSKCIDDLSYFKNITRFINIPLVVISTIYFIHPNLQIITFHITLKVVESAVLIILYNLSLSLNKIAYYQICEQYTQSNSNCMYSLVEDYNKVSKNSMFKNTQKNLKKYIDLRTKLKNLIRQSLYFYSSSLVLWSVENLFCEYVSQYVQLHAIWHLLSSIGIYHLNMIIIYYIEIDKLIYP
jgi:dihydroceramidase